MSGDDFLKQRLKFMRLDAGALAALAASRASIEAAVPPALDRFYERVRAFPEVARFFGDEAHIQAAKSAQVRHWARMIRGEFDGDYVASVTRIGQTHARIGLEPRWYLGGYALIIEHLVRTIITRPQDKRTRHSEQTAAATAETVAAVMKCAMLDMEIVISSYLEAAEKARLEAERRAIEQSENLVVSSFGEGLSRLERGDLTYRLSHEMPDAYLKLQEDYNNAIQNLERAMQVISDNARRIQSGAGEISTASDDLSRRTEQQAASLEETAAALDQVTATVKNTAENAVRADGLVVDARRGAERGGRVMQDAIGAMGELEKSSAQIAQIIGVIDEIAFQTNLLALNAGVEAARAGDAGRGFAVVASEVRALAQRAADAAKQIKGLIGASSRHVETGVGLVGQAGDALEDIVVKVNVVSQLVGEISASAQEQAGGLAQVNIAVNQMDQVTQQNAAMVEQSTAASRALAQEANELTDLMGQFTFSSRADDAGQSTRGPKARIVSLRR